MSTTPRTDEIRDNMEKWGYGKAYLYEKIGKLETELQTTQAALRQASAKLTRLTIMVERSLGADDNKPTYRMLDEAVQENKAFLVTLDNAAAQPHLPAQREGKPE